MDSLGRGRQVTRAEIVGSIGAVKRFVECAQCDCSQRVLYRRKLVWKVEWKWMRCGVVEDVQGYREYDAIRCGPGCQACPRGRNFCTMIDNRKWPDGKGDKRSAN
jgi:hypothetical protein